MAAGEEPDGEGSTDAMEAFRGVRISRCGLGDKVCVSLFSEDFVRYEKAGVTFSICRP